MENWAHILSKLVPEQSSHSEQSHKTLINNPIRKNENETSSPVNSDLSQLHSRLSTLTRRKNEQIFRISDYDKLSEKNKLHKDFLVDSQFICYLDDTNKIVVRSLKNLSLFSKVLDILEDPIDYDLIENGLSHTLFVLYNNGKIISFSIEIDQLKESVLITQLGQFDSQIKSDSGQILCKDGKNLAIIVNSRITLLDVSQNQITKLKSITLDSIIIDVSFSPRYSLIFALLDNNNVTVINFEGMVIKSFKPHTQSHVIKVISYRNLSAEKNIWDSSTEKKPYDFSLRDIFITITEDFEIKVWDLGEWDSEAKQYYCLETYQLNQSNDKFSPVQLIKRFATLDPTKRFLFIAFENPQTKENIVHALHINPKYYTYNEAFDEFKSKTKFFDSRETFTFIGSFNDISTIILAEDDLEQYFKRDKYIPAFGLDTGKNFDEILSNPKINYIFVIKTLQDIIGLKVPLERIYPFILIEDVGTRYNEMPSIPTIVQEIYEEKKHEQRLLNEKGGKMHKAIVHLENNEGISSQIQNQREEFLLKEFEKILERRFQQILERNDHIIEKKMNRFEELITQKFQEKLNKSQSEFDYSTKELDTKIQKDFQVSFEKNISPNIERYLGKLFEQVSNTFEKGQKFYIDKMNLEQAKSTQIKETMNDVIKSFVQISSTLTESVVSNQSAFNKFEYSILEKQNQLDRVIDQLNELLQKQQETQKKIETAEKQIQELYALFRQDLIGIESPSSKYNIESINPNSNIESKEIDENKKDSKGSFKKGSNEDDEEPQSSNYDTSRTKKKKKDDSSDQNNTHPQQNQGSHSNYKIHQKGSSLADQLPYLQSLANYGGTSRGQGTISPGSSQIFGGGYNYDYYNPYYKNRAGMMVPNFPPYNPQFGMPNYPFDLNMFLPQIEAYMKRKEEENNFNRNQDQTFFHSGTQDKKFFEGTAQNPASHTQTQQSFPVLSSQPSFGPPPQQTASGTPQTPHMQQQFSNPYYNVPQQMLNPQIRTNMSSSRNSVNPDLLQQIPLVNSLVKENKETTDLHPTSQQTTPGTENTP